MESSPCGWHFEFFGGLALERSHTEPGDVAYRIEHFQTRKTEALLAYLALHSGQRHSRESLIELLWPDADPDAGRNRLTQAVVWLRPQLEVSGMARGSVLFADRYSVALNADAVTTDIAQFEAALKAAEKGLSGSEAEIRIAGLREAVALWRGVVLPRLDDEWVATLRRNLLDQYLWALHHLVEVDISAGRHDAAIAYARRAVAAEPLAEEAHQDLVRALAGAGQISAARRHYREMERILAEALGESLSPTSRTLLESLRESDTAADPVAEEEVSSPSPIPAPLTRFFGRSEEIQGILDLLTVAEIRLVTLTGVGGAGKTRLAVEVARQAETASPVWFLSLVDTDDARQIPDALADLICSSGTTGSSLDRVIVALRTARHSLLVLDNLEHLLEGAPALVRILLESVPSLTILATSRQRLGIEGEHEWPVLPLPIPSVDTDPQKLEQNDGVRLFLDRARSVHPGFVLTAANAPAIASLCERLEGLPLAIELCAAWASVLTPAQMRTALKGRFDLLVSRRTDIPARHRSLRAAVENSYLLLPPDVQEFFVRLSVFRGGWTLEAAAEVCLDEDSSRTLTALRRLTELRERSLAFAESADGPEGGAMRYRMLETLREFASQQRTLASEQRVRQKHLHYFLGLAGAAETALRGRRQTAELARLESEVDNLRAALAWAVEAREAQDGLRLATALVAFWDIRSHFAEGQEWLERLLELIGMSSSNVEDRTLRAKAQLGRARMARGRADFATVREAAQEALDLATQDGDAQSRAQALLFLASLAYTQEDYDGAEAMQEEALELAREIEDGLLIASALLGLGNVAMERAQWDRAWSLYSECLDRHRRANDRVFIAAALNNMGLIARYRGDYDTARRLLEEDIEIGRAVASRASLAVALLNLATVLRLQGEPDKAQKTLREATALAREVDDRRALAWCVKEGGHLACARGDWETGIKFLALSESLRRVLGMSFKPADPDALETDMARAHDVLTADRFDALWREGGMLTMEAFLP